MSFRPAALLCLIGAVACSHNNANTETADNVEPTNVARSEPEMTPASLDTGSADATPSSGTQPSTAAPSTERTNAPLVADPQRTGSNDVKADPPASNAPGAAAPKAGNVPPDNTKVNERDKSSTALTPMDQRNNQTDLDITQQVRKAVMADGSLSFTAKNVKIITQAGKVTLRGPVNSAAERDAIDAAARKVAGVTQVDNQIEVKK